MAIGKLRDPLGRAAKQIVLVDTFRRRIDSAAVKELYDRRQLLSIPSAAAIGGVGLDLGRIMTQLEECLDGYRSSESGAVGNGLYFLSGSEASPRLPSLEDYARILVLAAARIGPERVMELFAGWLEDEGIRARSCCLLKGVTTEGGLEPVDGLRVDMLPRNWDDFPKSLRIRPEDHNRYEQFANRAILFIEFEVRSPLYDPDVVQGVEAEDFLQCELTNPALSNLSPDSFCRALALETNNHVDWFMEWTDYEDVEAFFLNPGFSNRRKEARDASNGVVSEEDVKRCLDTHSRLSDCPSLDMTIARWRNSKQARMIDDKLVELRIALELLLLSDDKRDAEKRHRLAARGAWLLGDTFEDRKKFFRTLRDAYDEASRVVHGERLDEKSSEGVKKTVAEAQDLCRQAILLLAKSRTKQNWSDLVLGGPRAGQST